MRFQIPRQETAQVPKLRDASAVCVEALPPPGASPFSILYKEKLSHTALITCDPGRLTPNRRATQGIDDAESEWSQHHAKRMIDTRAKGLRGSIPPNFPYFHVEFGLAGARPRCFPKTTLNPKNSRCFAPLATHRLLTLLPPGGGVGWAERHLEQTADGGCSAAEQLPVDSASRLCI